ncbi:MAG: DUF362 domain-containing protein [Bacteroidales bacterium]|nr:DUF362 domain-containing protein [Bacteroidales bacterium]
MKRRDFIRSSVSAGMFTGAAFTLGSYGALKAADSTSSFQLPYDMVAIRGGEPGEMFDRGIASLGGLKQFVKPNQTVVVKPNIGWDTTPEKGATTNPELVSAVIEQCKLAGAKSVYVFDNPVAEWTRSYAYSGIEEAAKKAGATVVSGKSEGYYQNVSIPKGKVLKNAKVHELILESDVFINIPVLKNHGGSTLTIAMKNLMGVVWDRQYWHSNDLHQCIADFATFFQPDLNIIDAYRVMKRNGPRGVSAADVVTMKYQIIATDMVAADAAATKVFGMEPNQLRHLVLAEQSGVGTSDIDALKINRLTLST